MILLDISFSVFSAFVSFYTHSTLQGVPATRFLRMQHERDRNATREGQECNISGHLDMKLLVPQLLPQLVPVLESVQLLPSQESRVSCLLSKQQEQQQELGVSGCLPRCSSGEQRSSACKAASRRVCFTKCELLACEFLR